MQPAQVSYADYSFSADFQLYWPQFAEGQTNIAALFMNMTPSTSGLNIIMPAATLEGNGWSAIIFNNGVNSVDVTTLNGNAIVTIASGVAYYINIEDNSTEDGVWGTVQFGAGTSSAVASQLAGAGLLASSGLLVANDLTAAVSNDFTVSSASRALVYVWTGGAGTIALPSAASVGNGFFFALSNNGSGSVTVSAGDNIDGAPTSVFSQGQSGFIVSTNSTYVTVGKGIQTNFSVTLLNLNVAGSSNVTETSAQAQNQIQQFTGLLTGDINVIVPNTVQIYYVFNNTTGAHTLKVKTAAGTGIQVDQGTHSILYCDGTNVVNAYTAAVSSTVVLSAGSAPSPSLSISGSPSTGLFSPAANQIAIAANGYEVTNFVSAVSSANYIENSASATGQPVTITAKGTDGNIGLNLVGKGTGSVGITKAAITGGTIDATVIGGATPAAGSFTTLAASSGFSGNAATATALQTARTIGGVSFNGTANITVATATGGFTVSGGDLAVGANNISCTGSLGSTGSRLTKGWFTDLQVTNSIAGSITGSAPTLTTPRAIYGNNFDGSAALTQIIASTFGGTGNGFSKFTGPTASEKTFTLPNATATILTSNAAVTVAQGGTGLATLTANNVILGNGTSAPQFVAPSTNGNVLTSNGSTWSSAAPGSSITSFFESTEQALASAVSVAHGLSRTPILTYVILRCKTAEMGYSIADEVYIKTNEYSGGGGGVVNGNSIFADSANIGWSTTTTTPSINNKSTGTQGNITAANWRVVLRAWA